MDTGDFLMLWNKVSFLPLSLSLTHTLLTLSKNSQKIPVLFTYPLPGGQQWPVDWILVDLRGDWPQSSPDWLRPTSLSGHQFPLGVDPHWPHAWTTAVRDVRWPSGCLVLDLRRIDNIRQRWNAFRMKRGEECWWPVMMMGKPTIRYSYRFETVPGHTADWWVLHDSWTLDPRPSLICWPIRHVAELVERIEPARSRHVDWLAHYIHTMEYHRKLIRNRGRCAKCDKCDNQIKNQMSTFFNTLLFTKTNRKLN